MILYDSLEYKISGKIKYIHILSRLDALLIVNEFYTVVKFRFIVKKKYKTSIKRKGKLNLKKSQSKSLKCYLLLWINR